MWDLSCVDWEARLRAGRSLVPDLPLIEAEADLGLRMFDEIPLPDVEGHLKLGTAAGQWFRDIVRAAFGSWDPVRQLRFIRDIFAMVPKGSSKTTYTAALMLAVMLMNRRPRAEALFIGPTQAISDRAYEQAVGMIDQSSDLKRRFRPRDHIKTIEDLFNHSEMKVKTFDLNILTGAILILALLDEIHLLGRNQHTTKVIRQIRGGLDKTPEGLFLVMTTQSDDVPVGAFKEELGMARDIRDGKYRGKVIRPLLPILYEFPDEIAGDPAQWQNPANWPMVMPNLGRSVHLSTLIPDWESERAKGDHAIRIWASQHVNLQIGHAQRSDRWPGAEFWASRADPALTLEELLRRCDVVAVGIDGGGLDDLYGLVVLGRCKETGRWLLWSHAWCYRGVLARRQLIASTLLNFENVGELTIADDDFDIDTDAVEIIKKVKEAGLLAAVMIDALGPHHGLVEKLGEIGVTAEGDDKQIQAAPQGIPMMAAIKTAELKVARGELWHSGSSCMAWAVTNLKIEPTATAIRATKQHAGDLKIDPAMAMFNAVYLMQSNPQPAGSKKSYLDQHDLLVI